MALSTIVKQPAEEVAAAVPFAALVISIDSVVVESRGLVLGGAALTAVAAIGAPGVQLKLEGGADGERYLVTVRVHTTDGQELEDELDVAAIDARWALPDGGTPWLSIVEFVGQVGYQAVVAMTDETGTGRIDRDLLTRALANAQAIAESYLAGRYALPLATVPPLLAMTVADLACLRLYPRGAPEGIKANAAAATNLLQRIQAGTAQLPIAGAPPAPAATSEAPVVVSPGRRAYPDGLREYASDPRGW